MAELHVGLPEETLREAAHKHVRVLVKVERRSTATGREKWGAVGSFTMDIAEVWMIESFVARECGSGEFKIDVFDAEDISERVAPPFTIAVEGKAKRVESAETVAAPSPISVRSAAAQPAPVAPAPGGQPVYPYHSAPPPQHYPGRPADAATAVALNELAELKAANAKIVEQLKAAQEREAQAREAAREAAHAGELKALHAKLEALSQREPPPPVKTFDAASFAAAIAPLATAFAPVIAAFVTSSKQAQAESARLQFEAQTALMNATLAQANKDSPIEKLLPLALPFIQSMIESKGSGSEKQAQLYEALMNGQLNTVSMMAQLLEAQAQNVSPESPVAEIVKAVVGAGGAALEGWFQSQGARAAAGALPPPAPELPPSAPSAPRTNPQVDELWKKIPGPFRTDDLRGLLDAVHASPLPDPEEAGEALAVIIQGHVQSGKVTEAALAGIEDPEATLVGFTAQFLPHLRQQPDWLRATAAITVRILREDGCLPTPEEDEQPETIEAIEAPSEPSAVEEVEAAAEEAQPEPEPTAIAVVEKPKRQRAAKQEANA